jgi:glycosyltransferase involved in cell wall biosynthesis
VEVHTYEKERARELEVRRGGHPFAKPFDMLAGAALRRARFLRTHAIGLLHLNNSPASGYDDWLPAARLARIPCVVSVMSVTPKRVSRVGRLLMRRFDAVIPVSHYIKDDWAAAGIPMERMHVVHHGVDVDAFRSSVARDPDEVRAELKVPPERALARTWARSGRSSPRAAVARVIGGRLRGRADRPQRCRRYSAVAGSTPRRRLRERQPRSPGGLQHLLPAQPRIERKPGPERRLRFEVAGEGGKRGRRAQADRELLGVPLGQPAMHDLDVEMGQPGGGAGLVHAVGVLGGSGRARNLASAGRQGKRMMRARGAHSALAGAAPGRSNSLRQSPRPAFLASSSSPW